MYVLISWYYHKSARMLARCPFYSLAAAHKSVHFCIMQRNVVLLHIFLHISIGGFVCQSSYCSSLKNMPFAKKRFRIVMRLLLILPRKVKVNVRFLVPVKSKKCFKWYVVSIFFKHCSAHRAFFVRHINSRASLEKYLLNLIRFKIRILAVRTYIVRRKGIYLSNACHIGNK
ncbi:hypothetical protein IMSAG049_01141 [Clostridiales bacterium]|nr:hypothetical protein IMSAG049_01141 [Clostridiales bacterium]